jgi:hypothetical protein
MIRGRSNLGVAQSAMIRTAIVQTHRGVQSFVARGQFCRLGKEIIIFVYPRHPRHPRPI